MLLHMVIVLACVAFVPKIHTPAYLGEQATHKTQKHEPSCCGFELFFGKLSVAV